MNIYTSLQNFRAAALHTQLDSTRISLSSPGDATSSFINKTPPRPIGRREPYQIRLGQSRDRRGTPTRDVTMNRKGEEWEGGHKSCTQMERGGGVVDESLFEIRL